MGDVGNYTTPLPPDPSGTIHTTASSSHETTHLSTGKPRASHLVVGKLGTAQGMVYSALTGSKTHQINISIHIMIYRAQWLLPLIPFDFHAPAWVCSWVISQGPVHSRRNDGLFYDPLDVTRPQAVAQVRWGQRGPAAPLCPAAHLVACLD
jgi:hypothetical protein